MYTKNINSWINALILLSRKFSLDFSYLLYTFNINQYFSFNPLRKGISYILFIKQINELCLNKTQVVFNNKCLCNDKIMYSNIVYNIKDVLNTFYENESTVYIVACQPSCRWSL